MFDSRVCVVDVETSGLNPNYDLIFEIGMVELNLSTGVTKILFEAVVKEFLY